MTPFAPCQGIAVLSSIKNAEAHCIIRSAPAPVVVLGDRTPASALAKVNKNSVQDELQLIVKFVLNAIFFEASVRYAGVRCERSRPNTITGAGA